MLAGQQLRVRSEEHESGVPAAQADSSLATESVTLLAREVLSRLATRPNRKKAPDVPALVADIEALCSALLCPDENAGQAVVDDARQNGANPETVYLQFLAKAAIRLGVLWEEGDASFAEVSIGSSRIQSIIRSMSPLFEAPWQQPNRSALFASVPGETHTLGVRMATDIFRRSGWEITLRVGLSLDELVTEVVQGGHHLLGLSAGGEHALPALESLLREVRLVAPQVCIMICGQMTVIQRHALESLGADAVASDVLSARTELDRLWEHQQNRGALRSVR
jgi:MerR family transcriptional regulator, light-induced transcriptional regulator